MELKIKKYLFVLLEHIALAGMAMVVNLNLKKTKKDMAKSPEEQIKDMIANLQKTTGKDMDAWKAIVVASGLQKHGEIVKFLKDTHGVTHGFANMITHTANASHAAAIVDKGEDLTADWFTGKEAMQPLYGHIMGIIAAMGNDIVESPKKGYMSLRRNRQFACVGPFTKAKLDLQIHLKGHAETDRLKAVKAGMTSHVVKIASLDEVDAEVIAWLQAAYDAC
jgi:predicted transport protein